MCSLHRDRQRCANLQPDNAPAQLPRTASAPLESKHSIALQHLSYTYPKAAYAAAARDLEVQINEGGLGLVGSTGA